LDYRQPAPGLFKPARAIERRDPSGGNDSSLFDYDVDEIEVEVAAEGEENFLPAAAVTSAHMTVSTVAASEVTVLSATNGPAANNMDNLLFAPEIEAGVVDLSLLPRPSVNVQRTSSSSAMLPANLAASQASNLPTVRRSTIAFPESSASISGPRIDLFSPQMTGEDDIMGPGNVDAQEADARSEVSENWAEDRYQDMTAEERQVSSMSHL
jgi:hypothetical protein